MRGLGVDVEAAVGDAGVLPLVEDVVESHFEVDVLQLELGDGIAEPGVAVLCGHVVVVVLHCGGEGELLGYIDVHFQSLGGRAHGLGQFVAGAVGLADVPCVTTAQYEVEPRQGRDGAASTCANGTRVERIDRATNQPLAGRITIAAKSANGGQKPVETFAPVETQAVAVGLCALVNGMHHARCSLIGSAVDLVVAGVAVVAVDAEESGGECAAIADAGTCPHAVGFGQLLDVGALERAVVVHDIAAVDAARVAHGLRVVGIDVGCPVAPFVVGREVGRDKQMDVAVLIITDAVVERLSVEIERTAQRQPPTAFLILVVLAEDKFVGVIPKVVAGRIFACVESDEVGLYAVQTGMCHYAVVQRESPEAEVIVGMEVAYNIARSHVLLISGRCAL